MEPQNNADTPDAGPQIAVNRIVVPIDFSRHSKDALAYAVPIAQKFGASLILIYVVEPTVYPHDFGFGHFGMAQLEHELTGKGKRELDRLIETTVHGQVPTKAVVCTGKPHAEITRVAKEEQADLIIIATHGHTDVEQLLFGTTAEQVIRKAHCSVLCWRRATDS